MLFLCERRRSRADSTRQDRVPLSWTNEQTRSSSASERGRQRLPSAILASGESNQAVRERP